MTPIVFNDIACLSEEGWSTEERTAIAEKVYTEHGVDGLVTLWACQDYYDPVEPLDTGFTPATAWWLLQDNPYASMVRTQLTQLSESDALVLLKSATFPPLVTDVDIWAGINNGHLKLFVPEKADKFSHASAGTVRRIVECFFPQYPQFTEPHCSVYLDVIDVEEERDDINKFYPHHRNVLEAFHDDGSALQYLVRVHRGLTVQRSDATPEMARLLSASDGEWTIYEDMGIAPEEAYRISKSLVVQTTALPLPVEFDI